MSRERRLGRGLEALLGRSWEEPEAAPAAEGEAQFDPAIDPQTTRDEHGQLWLDCTAIVANPYQPRQTFEEADIADLADSIRTHGICSRSWSAA